MDAATIVEQFQEQKLSKLAGNLSIDLSIKLNDYNIFWGALSNPLIAAKYVKTLIITISELEKKVSKAKTITTEGKFLTTLTTRSFYDS